MSKLNRSLTTMELININRAFAEGRGYKDLIRDFKKYFNVEMTKQEAKHFLETRNWSELMEWLTGEKIEPADPNIPALQQEKFKMFDQIFMACHDDAEEQDEELSEFESREYYIPHNVKYFNLPLYGEIITYRQKEPFIKCFILDMTPEALDERPQLKRRITKIETLPITPDMPDFLVRILRKINNSVQEVNMTQKEFLNNQEITKQINYFNMLPTEEVKKRNLWNIFDSNLFKKYNILSKSWD